MLLQTDFKSHCRWHWSGNCNYAKIPPTVIDCMNRWDWKAGCGQSLCTQQIFLTLTVEARQRLEVGDVGSTTLTFLNISFNQDVSLEELPFWIQEDTHSVVGWLRYENLPKSFQEGNHIFHESNSLNVIWTWQQDWSLVFYIWYLVSWMPWEPWQEVPHLWCLCWNILSTWSSPFWMRTLVHCTVVLY